MTSGVRRAHHSRSRTAAPDGRPICNWPPPAWRRQPEAVTEESLEQAAKEVNEEGLDVEITEGGKEGQQQTDHCPHLPADGLGLRRSRRPAAPLPFRAVAPLVRFPEEEAARFPPVFFFCVEAMESSFQGPAAADLPWPRCDFIFILQKSWQPGRSGPPPSNNRRIFRIYLCPPARFTSRIAKYPTTPETAMPTRYMGSSSI